MSGIPLRPRLALIGVSGYGRIHLQLALACCDRGEAELVAAVVINPDQESGAVAELRGRGCEIFSSYDAMLERHRGRIDLCLIPTGIHWHARMALAALQAGANVLVEKPLAGSVAEANAVSTAERQTGRFVAVGFQDCYDPETRQFMEELRGGAIGEVRAVRFLGIWPRPRAYFARNDWAGRLHVDGAPVFDSPLNNAFAHFVMLSLLLAGAGAGEVATVRSAELFRAHAIESFDTAVVQATLSSGTEIWLGVSHACRQGLEPDIVIEGSAGSGCWRYEKEAWLTDAAGRRHRRTLADQHAARVHMMASVLRRLRDPREPICTSAQATQHVRLIEQIHRAAPVREVPAARIDWSEDPQLPGAIPAVRGLAAGLSRAFEQRSTLAAAGLAMDAG